MNLREYSKRVLGNITKNESACIRVNSNDSGGRKISLVIGLSKDIWNDCFSIFEDSRRFRYPIRVAASGGFSLHEDNPYSNQPTIEQFAAGVAMAVHDLTMTVEGRSAQLAG